jgi:hypothetical protein
VVFDEVIEQLGSPYQCLSDEGNEKYRNNLPMEGQRKGNSELMHQTFLKKSQCILLEFPFRFSNFKKIS